jgi:beta-phosphoglucomutase-like phosphatase (HAD superfamily)
MMNLQMAVQVVVTETRAGLGDSTVGVRAARQAGQRVFQGAGDGHGELERPTAAEVLASRLAARRSRRIPPAIRPS